MLAARSAPTVPTEPDAAFFTRNLLPVISRYARRYLSPLIRCPGACDDAVQEVLVASWLTYCRLCRQGRAGQAKAGSLARYATLGVKAGRSLHTSDCGQPGLDVMSRLGQMRYGHRAVSVELDRLGDCGTGKGSIPNAVALNLDMEAWTKRLTDLERALVALLSQGLSVREAAKTAGVSHATAYTLRATWQPAYEQLTA